MTNVNVAWWNLENLFDHQNAARDPELARTLKSELKGWTAAVRDRKLDQLASIIRLMFDGAGPDLLGVCEVESEAVAKLLAGRLNLPGRQYTVLEDESGDARGIDVSFLVDTNALQPSDQEHQVVIKRAATRNIFWATMTVKATGARFVAVANHWPSRSAGQYESEPFRMLTGETLSYVLDNLLHDDATLPVLMMGDFNDEPFNRALQEYLRGTRDRGRVARARSPVVLNLMWPLLSEDPPGTFRFGTDWNMLDQFLVTKGLLRTQSRVRVALDTVAVFRPAVMRGTGGAAKPFGRPSKPRSFDRDGYSDHYPITVQLRAG
jgi:hypothetical protein